MAGALSSKWPVLRLSTRAHGRGWGVWGSDQIGVGDGTRADWAWMVKKVVSEGALWQQVTPVPASSPSGS